MNKENQQSVLLRCCEWRCSLSRNSCQTSINYWFFRLLQLQRKMVDVYGWGL